MVDRVFDVATPTLAAIFVATGLPVFVAGEVEFVAAGLGHATNEGPGFDHYCSAYLALDVWSWPALAWRLARCIWDSKTSFVIRLKKFRVAVIGVLPVPGAPLTPLNL